LDRKWVFVDTVWVRPTIIAMRTTWNIMQLGGAEVVAFQLLAQILLVKKTVHPCAG
jgi:hypothetical protein